MQSLEDTNFHVAICMDTKPGGRKGAPCKPEPKGNKPPALMRHKRGFRFKLAQEATAAALKGHRNPDSMR